MHQPTTMANSEAELPRQGGAVDQETGEHVYDICLTNAETGELEPASRDLPLTRSTFQVPKSALQKYQEKLHSELSDSLLVLADMFDDSDNRYYGSVSLEQKFLNDTHNISPVVFLLPTLFLFPFPAWLTVISIIIEICLHMWAHKTNKNCKDPQLRYRSPLHTVTSQFCAICKSQRYMEKIGQLQDERAMKVYSRKPTYVERVSVMT